MSRVLWPLLMVILLTVCAARTQTIDSLTGPNELTILSGPGYFQNLDNTGSPLIYRAYTFPIGFEYHYSGERFRHRIAVNGVYSTVNAQVMRDRFTDLNRKAYFGYADVSYALETYLANGGDAIRLYPGMAIRSRISARRYEYYGESLHSLTGSGSFESINSLSASIAGEYSLSKIDRLRIYLDVPLLALVLRLPYGLFLGGFEDGARSSITPIGKMWGWQGDAEYSHLLFKNFFAGARYVTMYYRLPDDAWHTASLDNHLSFFLTWRFGG